VPNTDTPKPDEPKPDESKPAEPQGVERAEAEVASAYGQIKNAQEDLARLDRLVSGMERGDLPTRPSGAGAEPGGTAVIVAPPSPNTPPSKAAYFGVERRRAVLLALAGFLLAVCIFGTAFASRYGHVARAIMARWAPPFSIAHREASEPHAPEEALMAQAATAAEPQPAPAATPSPAATKDVPSPGLTPSPGPAPPAHPTQADLAQTLKTITRDLASINEKLDQLKNGYDQKLREQADTIQQLKTTQEQSARDTTRMAAQIQAMQAQLTAASVKPAAQAPKREADAAPRPRQSVAATPRPRRPPALWRPRAYLDDSPWDDPYW